MGTQTKRIKRIYTDKIEPIDFLLKSFFILQIRVICVLLQGMDKRNGNTDKTD